ncbi:hypothetical protein FHY18_001024 [Xanthomonas arboricola]|nr:hypothetical protein [Xanthomonas sp. 3793]
MQHRRIDQRLGVADRAVHRTHACCAAVTLVQPS